MRDTRRLLGSLALSVNGPMQTTDTAPPLLVHPSDSRVASVTHGQFGRLVITPAYNHH
jgi:hypothetical protein